MISVCMATYNGSYYIEEQLNSILLQIGGNDEVIIVDDGSDDGTVDKIRSFSDKRIKVIVNDRNMGIIKSFEKAIYASSGEIIFLSDQDDIWMPDKLVIMSNAIINNQVDVVVCDAYILNDNKLELETFYQVRSSREGLIRNLLKNSYIGCCMAFSSHLKRVILPIPANIPMHDQWIGILGEMYGRVQFIEDRLTVYRRHNNNATSMSRGRFNEMAKKRKLILINLLQRWNDA